jgi:hypothetical protein
MDFLSEYEATCGTALARESGPWGECLMKNNRGSTTFLKVKKYIFMNGVTFLNRQKRQKYGQVQANTLF